MDERRRLELFGPSRLLHQSSIHLHPSDLIVVVVSVVEFHVDYVWGGFAARCSTSSRWDGTDVG